MEYFQPQIKPMFLRIWFSSKISFTIPLSKFRLMTRHDKHLTPIHFLILSSSWMWFLIPFYRRDKSTTFSNPQAGHRYRDFIAKDPEGLDSDRWIPLRGGARIQRGLLARVGFSQHLECGIHWSESSPDGSYALIPHPVARWAKTTP